MTANKQQGELWGTAPENWALYLEITFIPLYKKIINKTGVAANKDLLDIGCGSGLFMKMAGTKGATTKGIDLSAELLKIARQRNPLSILVNHDMQQLPFEDKHFDLVTGFNSIQYADDIPGVLQEIKRVLKDHGKLAIGIWGSHAECEALKVLETVASLLPSSSVARPGPLNLSAEGKVESLLLAAGLRIMDKGTIECPWYFSSLDEALKGILSAGPSAEAIQYAGIEKVKEELVPTLKAFNFVDDIYVLENVFHYYIAGQS